MNTCHVDKLLVVCKYLLLFIYLFTFCRTPQNWPNDDLRGNRCRNPGGLEPQVWCYTTDPNVEWDYCDIPTCPSMQKYLINDVKICSYK